MSRLPEEYQAIHKAADYYEPLMRTKIVKGLRALRTRVTIQHIVAAMQSGAPILPRKQVEAALAPAAKVVRDAVNQGGKLGAMHVNKAIK